MQGADPKFLFWVNWFSEAQKEKGMGLKSYKMQVLSWEAEWEVEEGKATFSTAA